MSQESDELKTDTLEGFISGLKRRLEKQVDPISAKIFEDMIEAARETGAIHRLSFNDLKAMTDRVRESLRSALPPTNEKKATDIDSLLDEGKRLGAEARREFDRLLDVDPKLLHKKLFGALPPTPNEVTEDEILSATETELDKILKSYGIDPRDAVFSVNGVIDRAVKQAAGFQMCSECGEPTGRKGEESVYLDDGKIGPLCDDCVAAAKEED